MKLVYEDSGKEVMVGDKSVTFRDDAVEVMYITKPHKPSSTGRVGVRFANELHTVEYYPGVIGATWIEREDQGSTEQHVDDNGQTYIVYK